MAKEENIILPVAAGLGLLLIFSAGSDNKVPPAAPGPGSPTAPTDFIRKYWNDALISQQTTTIPALFTITQGGLESGWGKRAPQYNFFGIKDSAAWQGATQLLWTHEYINGVYTAVQAKFRAYPSARAAFIDHGKFFIDNKRYHDALQYVNDNIKFARAIAAAGYATDPHYADKLIASMKIVVQVLQAHGMI